MHWDAFSPGNLAFVHFICRPPSLNRRRWRKYVFLPAKNVKEWEAQEAFYRGIQDWQGADRPTGREPWAPTCGSWLVSGSRGVTIVHVCWVTILREFQLRIFFLESRLRFTIGDSFSPAVIKHRTKRQLGRIRASLIVQTVKNPPAMQETWILSLGWEGPLEEGVATHSSILAWRIPGTEEPGGLQSLGSQSRTSLSDHKYIIWIYYNV